MGQAAELKIDSMPAEGFNNEILVLKNLGLKSVTLLYLVYRDLEKNYLSHMKKVSN
jgi:nitroreductase/dihydropteridine reductase